jgi:hypothetical protein
MTSGRSGRSSPESLRSFAKPTQIEEDILYEVSDEALEAAAENEALPAITMFCTGIGCPV